MATSSTTTSILQLAFINSGKTPGYLGQFLTPLVLSTLALVMKEELRLAQPKFCRKYQVLQRLLSSSSNNRESKKFEEF